MLGVLHAHLISLHTIHTGHERDGPLLLKNRAKFLECGIHAVYGMPRSHTPMGHALQFNRVIVTVGREKQTSTGVYKLSPIYVGNPSQHHICVRISQGRKHGFFFSSTVLVRCLPQ